MRITGTRKGRFCVLGAAVAVFASGCVAIGAVEVDPAGVPGIYRSEETGGEIRLHDSGRFSVAGISGSDLWWNGTAESVSFSGSWTAGSDANFVYLEADDTSGGRDVGDIQLYTASTSEVFLQPDPDGPVTLKLDKAASS
ncbi:hypothetical protein [Streptomyces sp. WG-D5]